MSYNIFDAAKEALTGKLKLADPKDVTIRRQLCDKCEIRDKLTDICTACGCFLPAKIRLEKSQCPMEIW